MKSVSTGLRVAAVAALALALASCTTVLVRSPAPSDDIHAFAPYGIRNVPVRVWGDTDDSFFIVRGIDRWVELTRKARAAEIATGGPVEEISLALSGGGPDGAFGAGLLNGWATRGDLPRFQIVTGVSTGAIVALFAFLGTGYYEEMTEVYTKYETSDLATPAFFAALTGGTAFIDTRGYRALIDKYVDDEVMARLAEEHLKGRALLIGTTNLDASRPVIWSLTSIASSGHPDAKLLVRDVIQASSAIPAAFPPVLIPVETADGARYDEMHVDGGATSQVIYLSPGISMKAVDRAIGVPFDRTIHVVINNKLRKPYAPVSPRVLSIASTAASSLIGGSGAGDIYKIFAITERDGIELKVISIPPEFDRVSEQAFDPVYMRALYDLGFEIGQRDDAWSDVPPGFRAN